MQRTAIIGGTLLFGSDLVSGSEKRVVTTPHGDATLFLKSYLAERGVTGVAVCALLDKRGKREREGAADQAAAFVGFSIPDRFVVGFGLDHEERWRELPYIGVLEGGR